MICLIYHTFKDFKDLNNKARDSKNRHESTISLVSGLIPTHYALCSGFHCYYTEKKKKCTRDIDINLDF